MHVILIEISIFFVLLILFFNLIYPIFGTVPFWWMFKDRIDYNKAVEDKFKAEVEADIKEIKTETKQIKKGDKKG